jgi:porin
MGTDLADIPELLLPSESGTALGTKQGFYFVGYSVQQFLWEHPHTPGAGWGLFGQVSFSDSNPNPFAWMLLAGLGGTGLIPGHSLDRCGAAYFLYTFSDELTDRLWVFGLDLGDEYGGELFYNAAVTPWCRLSGDLQIITPYLRSATCAGVHRNRSSHGKANARRPPSGTTACRRRYLATRQRAARQRRRIAWW